MSHKIQLTRLADFCHLPPMDEKRELSSDERLAWLRLIRSENVGPITFFQLLGRFKTAQNALDALPELARKGGRKKPIRICPLAEAKREAEAVSAFGGRLLAACEPDYPPALRMIADPPPVISIKGHAQLLNRDILAVVGARNSSAVAIRLTQEIAGSLSQENIVIASGLARGIDTAAHQASLTILTRGRTRHCRNRYMSRAASSPSNPSPLSRRPGISLAATGLSPVWRSASWWLRHRQDRGP